MTMAKASPISPASTAPADVPSAGLLPHPVADSLTASLPSDGRGQDDTRSRTAATGDLLAADHTPSEPHLGSVGGELLDSTDQAQPDTRWTLAGAVDPLTPGRSPYENRPSIAGGQPLTTPGYRPDDNQSSSAGCGDPSPTVDRGPIDTRATSVGGGTPPLPPGTAIDVPAPRAAPPDGWKELRIWAEMFEDAQKARIACTNRAERSGLDPTVYTPQLDAMKAAEHAVKLAMVRHYRRVVAGPIREWQQATPGIGEHLLARLLGVIGHPVHAEPHHWEGEGANRVLISDPPFDRNIAKLWAYCGHGDPTRKKAKGMTAEQAFSLGNPRAKMVVHLLSEACMKQRTSPYRIVYDHARNTYADREGWTPGHQHAAALRKVGKEVLRDLWIVARDT